MSTYIPSLILVILGCQKALYLKLSKFNAEAKISVLLFTIGVVTKVILKVNTLLKMPLGFTISQAIQPT